MALTQKDLSVLKILVDKELEHLKKDEEQLMIVNSPFLGKLEEDTDLSFLRDVERYERFLKELLMKLGTSNEQEEE
ncbi:MAG: hypothetical protein Q8Q01_04535 [archaeon]|nr:hypothetical protein [archaeon]